MSLPDDVKAYNRQLIDEFRAAGRVLGERPLLLMTTTGARSGKPHTTPLMYVPDGDRLLVIASNVGATAHPDWYRNLLTNPRVTVEVSGETFEATASPVDGEEHDRLFAQIAAQYPFFNDHQAKASRKIPVVALERS
jgi:deazaflavin-dependent oxidoreductase (nitroreductase family)